MAELKRTPLHDLHESLGARMVPFAGWEMPVQYKMGVMGEHLHTREKAGLFDVSHMGQVILRTPSGKAVDVAHVLEKAVPANIVGLAEGRQRYGIFTNDQGGILDDLMIANRGDHLFLVVNAACADQDMALLQTLDGISAEPVTDRALLALQGPEAVRVLSALIPDVAGMKFMDVAVLDWDGAEIWVSRSGYTGEDGYEVSVPAARAEDFAKALLADEAVAPIGLGARDSLRLEAGMPLYGHDMDAGVTPGAAALGWSIPKIRRQGGEREGGFPGADVILPELAEGAAKIRTGLRPEGRAPIREGVSIYDAAEDGAEIGQVCSGGFGPSVGGPVAMAILPAGLSSGDTVYAELRGKRVPAIIADLPFIKPDYKR
ncbi:glycine cleavage system aminomethyltransferase GcvT [Paracoccus aerodenitrificans]|uniref:glycine cleavage system aminomethyltransferase GcvT n=1 Tax=Paracoccus aerodenitrificans TaxID=3017781 RepID=UPI0022F06AD2|nr:glycine cleavage system aminomethyltransferase GcvT [Paracoccus aerodenitrificans]WBU63436.1 glycine cleavage system aminomethyltransferase GcvT [Paracoccus aerodenitrificans]